MCFRNFLLPWNTRALTAATERPICRAVSRAEGTSRIIGSRDGPTNGSLGRGCQSSGVPRQKEVTETHCRCRGIPKVQKGFSTIVTPCQQQSEGLLTLRPSGRAAKRQKDFSSQSALPTLPATSLHS